jgi:hypothetical protein
MSSRRMTRSQCLCFHINLHTATSDHNYGLDRPGSEVNARGQQPLHVAGVSPPSERLKFQPAKNGRGKWWGFRLQASNVYVCTAPQNNQERVCCTVPTFVPHCKAKVQHGAVLPRKAQGAASVHVGASIAGGPCSSLGGPPCVHGVTLAATAL